MSILKAMLPGAAGVAAASFLAAKLPATVDFGNLPVRNALVTVAGAGLALYALGDKSLKNSAIVGLSALVAAELADCAFTARIGQNGQYQMPIRVAAGAVGGLVGGKYLAHDKVTSSTAEAV